MPPKIRRIPPTPRTRQRAARPHGLRVHPARLAPLPACLLSPEEFAALMDVAAGRDPALG